MVLKGKGHPTPTAYTFPNCKAGAHLGGQDSQDSQGLRQVQQAPVVQVGRAGLFLLSFLCHPAVLVGP